MPDLPECLADTVGLDIRRRPDEKTGLVLPAHGTTGGAGKQPPAPPGEAGAPPEEPGPGKEEEETPGGLAEIIRDLTRRPRA